MTAAELKKWCDTKAAVVLGTSGVFAPTGEVERLREAMVVALGAAMESAQALINAPGKDDAPYADGYRTGASTVRSSIHALARGVKGEVMSDQEKPLCRNCQHEAHAGYICVSHFHGLECGCPTYIPAEPPAAPPSDPIEEMANRCSKEIGAALALNPKEAFPAAIIARHYRELHDRRSVALEADFKFTRGINKELAVEIDRLSYAVNTGTMKAAEREKQVRGLRDRVEYLEGAWFVDETICKDGSLRPDITKTLARLRVAEVQVRKLEERLVSDRALLIAERDAALDGVRELVQAARDLVGDLGIHVDPPYTEIKRLRAILEAFREIK